MDKAHKFRLIFRLIYTLVLLTFTVITATSPHTDEIANWAGKTEEFVKTIDPISLLYILGSWAWKLLIWLRLLLPGSEDDVLNRYYHSFEPKGGGAALGFAIIGTIILFSLYQPWQ
jgi:membrane protease YdiL (CAAX protease family)